MRPGIWTEKIINSFKDLLEEDAKRRYPQRFSALADELSSLFGLRFTKNMLIGKARRMGAAKKMYTPEPGEYSRRSSKRTDRGPSRKGPRLVPARPVRVPVTEPTAHRCELVALTITSCRWPHGDVPNTMFCGAPSADLSVGQPYCPFHAAMAYRPRGVAAQAEIG